MKKKVDVFRPLYWFCFFPIIFVLLGILQNIVYSIIYSGATIPKQDWIPALLMLLLSVSLLIIYLKTSKQSDLHLKVKNIRLTFWVIIKGVFLLIIFYCLFCFCSDPGYYLRVYELQQHVPQSTIFLPLSTFDIKRIPLYLLNPISEEIMFRRVIYDSMKRQSNSIVVAIIFSTILFALAHIPGDGVGFSLSLFIERVGPGIIFAYCYEETGSFLPSIMLHYVAVIVMLFLRRLSIKYFASVIIYLSALGIFIIIISLPIILFRRKNNDRNHRANQLSPDSVPDTQE